MRPSSTAPLAVLPQSVPWTAYAFSLWALSVLVFAGGTVWRNARFRRSLKVATTVVLPDDVIAPGAVRSEIKQRFESFFAGEAPSPGPDGALESHDVDEKPQLIKQVSPVFPESAREQGLTGKVFVRFRVDAEGSVREAIVLKGHKALRQAAIDAVLQFVFKPALLHGTPVAVWVTMPIRFPSDDRPAPSQDSSSTESRDTAGKPAKLLQNRPDPFNPETIIPYYLADRAVAKLEVLSETGQVVCTLVDGAQPSGRHEVRWDGRDSSGRSVASGVYFYRIRVGDFSDSRKMMVLR